MKPRRLDVELTHLRAGWSERPRPAYIQEKKMAEYTGFIMFLWIVGAPTIGLLVLSMWEPRSRTTTRTPTY